LLFLLLKQPVPPTPVTRKASQFGLWCRDYRALGSECIGEGVVIISGRVKIVGNRFESSGRQGTLSADKSPLFESALNSSGSDDEPLVGKPVGQLLMGTALGTVELDVISEALFSRSMAAWRGIVEQTAANLQHDAPSGT
jgi:hypothetical protein